MLAEEIVPISDSVIPEAADILAHAFQDNAGIAFLIPDAAERARNLPALFLPVIRVARQSGEAVTTGGAMRGVALWLPPGRTTPLPEDLELADIGEAAERLGNACMARFGSLVG